MLLCIFELFFKVSWQSVKKKGKFPSSIIHFINHLLFNQQGSWTKSKTTTALTMAKQVFYRLLLWRVSWFSHPFLATWETDTTGNGWWLWASQFGQQQPSSGLIWTIFGLLCSSEPSLGSVKLAIPPLLPLFSAICLSKKWGPKLWLFSTLPFPLERKLNTKMRQKVAWFINVGLLA